MSNKIIKISIVLIFMLFVTGLFNFCFAFTEGVDFEIISDEVLPNNRSATSPYYIFKLTFIDFKPDYELPNTNNVIMSGVDVSTVMSAYNNYGYVLTYNSARDEFDCYIPTGDYILGRQYVDYSQGGVNFYESLDVDFILDNSKDMYVLQYDFDTNKWTGRVVSKGRVTLNTIRKSGAEYEPHYWIHSDFSVYDGKAKEVLYEPSPSIDMKVVQTGIRTGHVEFIPTNCDSLHMYYVKDDMDELVRLIAEEELSITHEQVKHYDGPVDIEYGEYVLGLLFDDNGNMCFSKISDSVTIDYDILTDNTHKLYLDKENENIYYLSIHGYQDGDYIKVSDVPISNDAFSNHSKTLNNLNTSLEYNGLFIGQAYDTNLGHKNRKINLSKNGLTYFYLYDKDNNLINCVVLNSSNYYSGEEFNFDVELQFGSSLDDSLHLKFDEIRWVKVIPIIDVPSIDNYELYLRISDYGNVPYIQEEDRCIFATHDTNGNNYLGVDIGTNSNTNWYRIDDKINSYFYINTLTHDSTFTFELQLRSGSGQIIQTKSFKVNLSTSNKTQGTISSTTDGKNDTYIRNPNELSNSSLNSSNFDFSGLYDLNQEELTQNVNGLINNTTGFFSIVTTILLLLPPWISSLIFLFLTGLIVITFLRFLRGS